jgi:hypothetical protein
MEKRGIRTERGNLNREAAITNSEIRQLRARISKLRVWLKTEIENAPPTFTEIIESMLQKRQGQGRYKQITDLKLAANTLNFIRDNDIQDIDDFRDKVGKFYSRQTGINDKLKKVERRIKTLDEHIKQAGIYKQYGGFKVKYDKLCVEYKALEKASGFGAKRKAQKALDVANAYYEAHRAELTLHAAAVRYFQELQRGHDHLPNPSTWEDERAKLEGEKKSLYQQYYTLKDEVKQVEIIRRHVEDMIREESREREPRQRSQGLEL